jgi:hypothetical protein
MADYFWGAIREKTTGVAPDSRATSSRLSTPGFFWALYNLVLRPSLVFLKRFFFQGQILKGRGGLASAVHESVLLFGANARRYELSTADKTELEKIRREF